MVMIHLEIHKTESLWCCFMLTLSGQQITLKIKPYLCIDNVLLLNIDSDLIWTIKLSSFIHTLQLKL